MTRTHLKLAAKLSEKGDHLCIGRLPFGPVTGMRLGALTVSRAYDQRYQVSRIQAGAMDYGYTRNAAGQVTAITGVPSPEVESGTGQFAINPASNQLTGHGAAACSYDANGNLTSDGALIYTWDALNRMTQVSRDGEVLATMATTARTAGFARRWARTRRITSMIWRTV